MVAEILETVFIKLSSSKIKK